MNHPIDPWQPHHPSGRGEVPDQNASQAPPPSPYEQQGHPQPPDPPTYAPRTFVPPAPWPGLQGTGYPQPSQGPPEQTAQPGQRPGHPAPNTPPPPLTAPPPGQPQIPSVAPAYDPTAPPPTRRGVDSSSITTLFLNLPLFLGSFLVIWTLSQMFPTGLDVAFVLAWLASGALMFHRPTERTVAKLLYKVHQPTSAELAKLQPLWDEVARRAGLDGSRYDLWIENSDEVNAFAAAGHIVGVTRNSLNQLPPDQLAAVLAHELGHHVGGHAWSGLLGIYYAFPARIVMATVKFIVVFVFMLAAEIATLGAVLVALVIGTLAISVALAFPPALALFAVPLLLAWAGRLGEMRADRFAGEIGYGPLLITTLTSHMEQGTDDAHRQQGALTRLMSTHPPLHTRILALETFVAGPSGSLPA